jgi:hypothetical protein
MCETCSKVCIGKRLSDAFPVENGLKNGDALSPFFLNFPLEYLEYSISVLIIPLFWQRRQDSWTGS